MKRTHVIFGGLVLVVVALVALVASKERLLARGTPLFLELAPVDPRSLIQGDYMVLDYAVSREAGIPEGGPVADGRLVIRRDERGVGHYVRSEESQPLAPGESWLRYKVRRGRVRLGAESFFFQEGHAEHYARAKYGELRVAEDGSSVLVGLRDADLHPLGGGPLSTDPDAP
ncbi:membrane protein [Cystobacter fuscus]|uniref:Membrane protein n=1 Tax=Cystobacter fuscus TaxID=43 RepID=A0A250JFS9_9BACT|nr:GDYXXLXY domain-containing protein [Cystobacter fuscus]ATB42463.1 membrane protein [Cystobacter fuscus]